MSELFSTTSPCNLNSAYVKCARYLRKIFKFDQMDFEFALWQMFYLFANPQKLIKLFRARKLSKSQYARDDPAFLVLFAGVLSVSSLAVSLVLRLSFWQFLQCLFVVVVVDCLGFGLLVATGFWFVTNRWLKGRNVGAEDVEWGFCFDVHLNAFFPPLILLHVVQLVFYNGVISHDWTVSVVLGNTFWLCSCLYYFYITFLGYDSLRLLENTRCFLLPVPWVVVFYLVSLGMGWNVTHHLMNFYRDLYLG